MIDKNNAFKYLHLILNLERNVAAARFIEFKSEYDKLDVPEMKGSICLLCRRGLEGKHLKADEKHILCSYGGFALGITKPDITISSGQSYAACGLYNSKSVSRSIVESVHYLEQDVYGIEIAPLTELDNADLVFIVCNTRQAMRIMQGYAYYYGAPKNISFIGNQAMCGDIISKPFYNNDINLTLFCKGARKYGAFTEGEIGISMPREMFNNVAHGVFMTINPVEFPKEKVAISERLKEAGIECEFDMKDSYGERLDNYDNMVKEMRK